MYDIIARIIEDCTSVNTSVNYQNKDCVGYYLKIKETELDNPTNEKFRRLLLTAFRSANKLVMSEYEAEDVVQYTFSFFIDTLHDIFSGHKNIKLNDELKVHSKEDIDRILNDEDLLSQLCKFTYQTMINQFRLLVQKGTSDSVVEYEDGKRTYKPITRVFIDDKYSSESDTSLHEILVDNTFTPSTGPLTRHILSTYKEFLTNKQKEWLETVLEYGFNIDGATYNYANELIYSPGLNYKYKRNIKKRLLPLIESDSHIDISFVNNKERWVFRP